MALKATRALVDQKQLPISTWTERRTSRKSRLHRPHGLISHAWQEVRVGVQGHRYRGVPQKLLNELRMGALRESNRVAQV